MKTLVLGATGSVSHDITMLNNPVKADFSKKWKTWERAYVKLEYDEFS